MNYSLNDLRAPEPGSAIFLEVIDKFKEVIDMTDISTFFECGTGDTGDNAIYFSTFFKVITVDLSEQLYNKYCNRKGVNHDVQFLLGDASLALKEYLIAHPNERLLILLDDHTGYTSFIEKELNIIDTHSLRNDHIIIVDDCEYFGKGSYPTKSSFETAVRQIRQDYIISDTGLGNDIIIIYPPLVPHGE